MKKDKFKKISSLVGELEKLLRESKVTKIEELKSSSIYAETEKLKELLEKHYPEIEPEEEDNENKEDASMKGVWTFTLEDIHTHKKRVYSYENIIPTVGRTMIMNNLVDSAPDNSMLVEYIALGTGTTAPANGDVALETEAYRNDVASRTNAANVGYVSGFFSATETTGSFKEAAIFCDATGVADSGIILSRVAIDIIKSNTETLTIDWSISIL